MIVSNKLEPYNICDQLNKAIDTLEKYTEENLTQEEIDRRNWKFAGVQFVVKKENKE